MKEEQFIKYKGEIFISYKKTDNNGKLTDDREFVIELVKRLKEKGYKVFFAEENLKNYAGKVWEKELEKALNRAQVCIVYCSRKEFFTSKWVSKEWNAFKNRMENEKDNQLRLIPIYDSVDALPEELKNFQGLSCKSHFFMEDLTNSLNRFYIEREFSFKEIEFELIRYEMDIDNLKKYCLDYLTSLNLAETDVKYRFSLGCCYYLGLGIKKDLKRALYWWGKSAKQFSSEVSYLLATYYLLGVEDFLDIDYEKGLDFLYSSAQQNFALAQNVLGECYYFGKWLTQDYNKAVEWFTKSAEQGYAKAQCNLGICYKFGDGVEKNSEKAVEWYSRSAEQGYAKAQCNLGICYKFGDGVEKNSKKAVEWYSRSAEQGYAKAQCNLGICFYNGDGVEKNSKKAVEWFTKSAEQDNARALYNLGVCYYFGEGVIKDLKKAIDLYTKSAKLGYKKAQYSLGNCYEYGDGIKSNLEKAIYWYEKACEQGYADAIKELKRLGVKV